MDVDKYIRYDWHTVRYLLNDPASISIGTDRVLADLAYDARPGVVEE